MTSLAFLGVAVALSLLGCVVLWVRNRKPSTMQAHMNAFARELRALAPDGRARPPRRASRPSAPGNGGLFAAALAAARRSHAAVGAAGGTRGSAGPERPGRLAGRFPSGSARPTDGGSRREHGSG